MAITIPSVAERNLLDLIAAETFTAHLFDDSGAAVTLDSDTTLADLEAVELSVADGYADSDLTGATVATEADGTSAVTYTQIDWEFTGTKTVSGYFITGLDASNSDILMWCERLTTGDVSYDSNGGTFSLIPVFELNEA